MNKNLTSQVHLIKNGSRLHYHMYNLQYDCDSELESTLVGHIPHIIFKKKKTRAIQFIEEKKKDIKNLTSKTTSFKVKTKNKQV